MRIAQLSIVTGFKVVSKYDPAAGDGHHHLNILFKRFKCIQKLANRPVADGVQGQLAAMPDTV